MRSRPAPLRQALGDGIEAEVTPAKVGIKVCGFHAGVSTREGVVLPAGGAQITQQRARGGLQLQLGRAESSKGMQLQQLKSSGQAGAGCHSLGQLQGRPGPGPFHHQIEVFIGRAASQQLITHSSPHQAQLQVLL